MHAEVRSEDGRWLLVDLGSSNGTWSGESRIDSVPLSDGFTFRIGKTVIRFDSSSDAAKAAGQTTSVDALDPQTLEGLDEEHPSLLTLAGARAVGPELASGYLVLLHQIVLKSNAARSRNDLFEVLDEAATEALEGDRCAVFLPSPAGWTLWPAHERRLRARYGAVPFARTLLAAVRSRMTPLLCTRQGDLSPSASMVQAGVRSAMAAPLRVGEETHALLYVDRVTGGEPFKRSDLEFLAAVANQLALALHNLQHVTSLEAEVERLHARPVEPVALLWKDPAMQELEGFIAKAGAAASPVLIRGEPGTGKELAARSVHQRSPRAHAPLQIVACAALEDADAALFGSAAAGAEPRPGLAELADQGSIFLDDVDALPAPVQAKLLGLLDRGEFTRAGDGALRRVDVRVIAATGRDLDEEVRANRFKAELRGRLDVLSLAMPPLRARPADVDALAEHFLQECARKLSQPAKRLSPEARALLLRYSWPGNVRQLKNAIERASVAAPGEAIRPQDLPEALREAEPAAASTTPITSLAEIERLHIQRVLDHCGGNKKAAAEILGIDRSTLYAKLRQYGQA
jgi:DNA-binding NtrC family response regulator